MRLLVHMMVPLGAARGSSSEIFECRAVRLHGPVVQGRGRSGKLEPYIVVDIELPDRVSGMAARHRFNRDGTYPVHAYLSENRKSLAGFLTSGALELYVGDEP
ncbi:hypothetical protein [Burkholderia plantarii]|uniref:hypothetical protein n=1 Tax=Burkholderia plantarii TaxID=41899 RepID=UPI00087069BF|nr:hypothetical protein [Burkholderia plantarii]